MIVRFLSPRLLRVLLVLSVALNLAVIGVVAGAVMRDPPRQDPSRGPAFGPYDRALTEEDRKALREAFRREVPQFREEWRQMQDDMAELQTALRADPYDPAHVAEVFARQHVRGAQMMALGQKLLAERLAAMTPEERAAYANRLEQRMDDRRDRRPPH